MKGLTSAFSFTEKKAKKLMESKMDSKRSTSTTISDNTTTRSKSSGSAPSRTTESAWKVGVEEEGGCGGEQFVHCALLGDGMVGKTSLTLRYTQHRFTPHYTATVFDNYPAPVCVGEKDFTISVFDTAGQRDYESLRAYTYQSSEVLVLCFSVCDRESFYSVLNCWLPEIQRHTKGKRPLLLVGTQIDLRTSSSPSYSSSSSTSSSSLSNSSSPSFSFTDLGTSHPHDLTDSCSSSPSSFKKFSSSGHRPSPSSSTTSPSPVFTFSRRNSISSIDSLSSDLKNSSSSSPSSNQDEVSTEEGSQLAKMIGADCYIECSARSGEGVRQVFEHVVFSALKYRRKKKGLRGKLCRGKPLSGKALQRVASALNIPAGRMEDTL